MNSQLAFLKRDFLKELWTVYLQFMHRYVDFSPKIPLILFFCLILMKHVRLHCFFYCSFLH